MDRIHYSGLSLLTGTEIARALLDYAQALSQAVSSDTVDVPTIDDDGKPVRVAVLVGPASQLVSASVQTDREELIDEDLVARLRALGDHLRRYGPPGQGAVIGGSGRESDAERFEPSARADDVWPLEEGEEYGI